MDGHNLQPPSVLWSFYVKLITCVAYKTFSQIAISDPKAISTSQPIWSRPPLNTHTLVVCLALSTSAIECVILLLNLLWAPVALVRFHCRSYYIITTFLFVSSAILFLHKIAACLKK